MTAEPASPKRAIYAPIVSDNSTRKASLSPKSQQLQKANLLKESYPWKPAVARKGQIILKKRAIL